MNTCCQTRNKTVLVHEHTKYIDHLNNLELLEGRWILQQRIMAHQDLQIANN